MTTEKPPILFINTSYPAALPDLEREFTVYNYRDAKDRKALVAEAARTADVPDLQRLLKVDSIDLFSQDDEGNTALHVAAGICFSFSLFFIILSFYVTTYFIRRVLNLQKRYDMLGTILRYIRRKLISARKQEECILVNFVGNSLKIT